MQGLLLQRICSSEEILEGRLDDLKGFLMERGYDPGFIEKQFNRVRNHDRKTVSERCKGRDNRVCFVIDFHPAFSSLNGTLQKMQSIVEMSSDFFKVVPEKPLLSFRRPRNLKDHLVRSKL